VNTIKLVVRRLAPLVLVAFAAGAIAAHADSGGRPATPRVVVAPSSSAVLAPPPRTGAIAPFGSPAVLAPPPRTGAIAPLGSSVVACKFTAKPPTRASTPPSQALLDAFAILRRERRPEDALPAEALEALEQRNLAPVSPESARLLRTGPQGGRAWVVPVPDVSAAFPFPCVPKGKRTAREGLAVVTVGGAAPGGGGALDDLVRGRAPAWVDACAGDKRDMVGISGIVPNGVASVFLTAPDGTAVRADVKDNGYEFLVPRPRTLEQRYVVWTGGDGTPHVQPVATVAALPGALCKRLAASLARMPQVTPAGGLGACVLHAPVPLPARPPRTAKQGRVVPVPPRLFLFDACAGPSLPAQVVPIPRAPRPKHR
jgi:hypothetical protein